LLGDRRSTLTAAQVRQVKEERMSEADGVNPMMLIEPLIFGCHDRLGEERRDLAGPKKRSTMQRGLGLDAVLEIAPWW
jgi:hypothetical protein